VQRPLPGEMGHAFEGQAGSISRALLALRDAPECQAITTGSQDLAVRAESNAVGTTSELVIGWGERVGRCQVPDLHGLRCRAKLSRGQQASVRAKGDVLDR